MLHYVKRRWDERRGDQSDSWGMSWWNFEVNSDGWVLRQVEEYDSGKVLCYSAAHEEAEYGGLSQVALTFSAPECKPITIDEFEERWTTFQDGSLLNLDKS